MRTVRDWLFTVPFLFAFGLGFVLFDVAGRIARPFGLRPFEYVMASFQWYLMHTFRICGARFDVERPPSLAPSQGYAIIANHQSLFDIPLIGGLLFSNFPKYIAKKELARGIPALSLNLRWGGNGVIDRKDRTQAFRTIKEVAARAQERNVSLVIFPEGTRSRDGRLGEFKRGGTSVLLAAADRLPVVPAAISGSWRLARNNLFPVPFGARVRIRFGSPITRTDGDVENVLERAHDFIAGALHEWGEDGLATA